MNLILVHSRLCFDRGSDRGRGAIYLSGRDREGGRDGGTGRGKEREKEGGREVRRKRNGESEERQRDRQTT